MIKLLKYEIKRFVYEKKYIPIFLIAIIVPFLVTNYNLKFANDDSHQFGTPIYENGRKQEDKYTGWKENYKTQIKNAEEVLTRMDYHEGQSYNYNNKSSSELEELFSARVQFFYYSLLYENEIAPYDWRVRYLEDLSVQLIECYGDSKSVKKEKKEINENIKKLLSDPWKELLEGGTEIELAFSQHDEDETQYSLAESLQEATREHNQFLIDNNIVPNKHESNWKYSLALKNLSYKKMILESEYQGGTSDIVSLTDDQVSVLNSKIKTNIYSIKNNILPINEGSRYAHLLSMDKWIVALMLILLLLFGINVSIDIKEGTFKTLIMHTKNKHKIIFAKVIFFLLVALIGILLFYICSLIYANIFFDSEQINTMVININDKYFNLNIYLVVMLKFLLNLIPASFWLLFVLMFVMAFESGEFAVGFSVFCLGGFEYLKLNFANGTVYTWVKYIPMYNIEFSRFLNPDGLYPYYNFVMSLLQFLLYLVVMYIGSYKFFEKYQG